MKVEPYKRTWYQDEIVRSNGNRIQIGARQSGKSESVVQETADRFEDGQQIVVIAPKYEMAQMLGDRVAEHFPNQYTTSELIDARSTPAWAVFYPATMTDYDDIARSSPDAIVIDEANHVSPELLFSIEREFAGDVLLTATPLPKRTPVELWAKHSPYWESWQISASDVPYIDDHNLRDYKESLDTDQEKREIDAKIL